MKRKIVLEYPLRCTSGSLFRAVSTPLGLQSWFADRVEAGGNRYDFFWGKTSQTAWIVHTKPNVSVRFQWDGDEKRALEMRIDTEELTGGTILTITDFVNDEELDEERSLWDTLVEKLKRAIGCPKN